jgi:hypothetical protein
MANKDNEIRDLQLFLTLLGDIPESACVFQDAPDLYVPDRALGIEHTRFYHDDPCVAAGRQKRPQEKLHDELLQRAQEVFRSYSDEWLRLDVSFTEPFNSRKYDLDSEARALAHSVLAALSRYPAPETRSLSIKRWQADRLGIPFPKSLDAYILDRVRSPGLELWAAGYSYMLPPLTVGAVEARIREKERHLPQYRTRCQTTWLLMATDTGLPSSHLEVTDALKQHLFTTLFDRLWLLLLFPRQLIPLITHRPTAA